MNQILLFVIAVQLSYTATTLAEDYLLRVDTIGFINEPVSEGDSFVKGILEKDPKDRTLKSMEVVVSPGSTFHSKVKVGPQTLTLAGKLRPAEGGRFHVEVRYQDVIDTGTTVLMENGPEPVLDISSFGTGVEIALDTPITAAGTKTTASTTSEPVIPTRSTQIRYVLTLTKYVPTAD